MSSTSVVTARPTWEYEGERISVVFRDLAASWLGLIVSLLNKTDNRMNFDKFNGCYPVKIAKYKVEYIDPKSVDRSEFVELVADIFYVVLVARYGRHNANALFNRIIHSNARVTTDDVEKGVYEGLLAMGVDLETARDIIMLSITNNTLDKIITTLEKYCKK